MWQALVFKSSDELFVQIDVAKIRQGILKAEIIQA